MGQVTWELSGGVRALRALNDMLYEAANACGLKAQLQGDRDGMGVYLDKRDYWIGIEYDQPETLTFMTWNRKVDKDAAEALGIGAIKEWSNHQGYHWRRSLNLESEDVHFFARSNASQMQLLEHFLRECLDTVKRIEVRDQESSPDKNDEADPTKIKPPDSSEMP